MSNPSQLVLDGLADNMVQASQIHFNLGQEVIITNEDKLRLALQRYKSSEADKHAWLLPVSLAATILLSLTTADCKDAFRVPAATWKAIYVISLVITGLWSIAWICRSIKIAFKSSGIDTLIHEIKLAQRPVTQPTVVIQSALVEKLPPAFRNCDIQRTDDDIALLYFDHTQRDAVLSVFPQGDNLAGDGHATASSQYGTRLPQNVLKGLRQGDSWTLDGPAGWIEINWANPPSGRYLVLVGRTSHAGADPWGKAKLSVNKKDIGTLHHHFGGRHVLVIEFPQATSIQSFRAEIDGATFPGLAGVEIHP